LLEESFSHSKVQVKTFCPPVKPSWPPAEKVKKEKVNERLLADSSADQI